MAAPPNPLRRYLDGQKKQSGEAARSIFKRVHEDKIRDSYRQEIHQMTVGDLVKDLFGEDALNRLLMRQLNNPKDSKEL